MGHRLFALFALVCVCALCSCTWLDHLPSPGLSEELANLSQHGLVLVQSLAHGSKIQLRYFNGHTETLATECCLQQGSFEGIVHNRIVMLEMGRLIGDAGEHEGNRAVLLDAHGRVQARSELRFYGGNVVPSADGKQFAFHGYPSGAKFEQTGIYVAGIRGQEARKLMPALVPLGEPATLDWSPDGRTLLVSRIGIISLIDLQTGHITKIADGSFALWSPDGRWISFVTPEREAALFDVAARRVEKIDPGKGTGRPLEWSPDGRYLLVSEAEGSHYPYGCLWVLRVADRAFTPIVGYGQGGPHPQWLQR